MRTDTEIVGAERESERATRPGDRTADRTGGLWDIHGVSAYLSIPVSSVYKMTARRARVRIPHIRIGGKLRFRQDDIDRWLSMLTVSNLETLAQIQRKATRGRHT